MAVEPNTGLTLSPPGPLQADLIVNPVMRRLGAVGGNSKGVIDRGLNTPPGSPADGDSYIVGTSPTGAWSGHGNAVAYWNGLTWDFYAPQEGWIMAVLDEDLDYRFDGSTWVAGGGGSSVSSVNGDTGVVIVLVPLVVACSDETTPLTAGTGKVTFRMPFAMTLSAVRASLTTAQASGTSVTVDINQAGSSILSTKITIDNTEKTSTTAATPPVISDTSLDDDAEITVDIDDVGDGTATGLKIALIGYPA